MSANVRFAILAILLIGAGLFLKTRASRSSALPPLRLATVPLQLGNWEGVDLPFTPRTLAGLGPGEFLLRRYRGLEIGEPDIDLFLAHRSRDRRDILESHLPTECLVGSGWTLQKLGTAAFSIPGYSGFTVNRYLITRGSERQLVVFWFWAHGRAVGSQNWADFYLTLDSLRMNRNDFLLLRLNTPMSPVETVDEAQRRLVALAAQVNYFLDHQAER